MTFFSMFFHYKFFEFLMVLSSQSILYQFQLFVNSKIVLTLLMRDWIFLSSLPSLQAFINLQITLKINAAWIDRDNYLVHICPFCLCFINLSFYLFYLKCCCWLLLVVALLLLLFSPFYHLYQTHISIESSRNLFFVFHIIIYLITSEKILANINTIKKLEKYSLLLEFQFPRSLHLP